MGNTLAEIAGEKAGIIKQGVPLVVGETVPETRPVFEAMASSLKAPITFAEDQQEIISVGYSNKSMEYHTRNFGILQGELTGIYQEKNTNTVLCAVKMLEKLGYMHPVNCSPSAVCQNREVRKGFKKVCSLTGLKGRWQIVNETPLTICDTGHNVAGWQYLSRQISDVPCRNKHIVFGMVEDKDVEGVLALLPKEATYYFTKSDNKRALSESILKLYAQNAGLQGESYPDVQTAYNAAKKNAENSDLVFIGGSSYVVADFLKNCI